MDRLIDLLPRYEAAQIARGRRPRGIARYLEQIRRCMTALGPESTLAQWTSENLADYQEACALIGWKPPTILNALTALRSFSRWAQKRRLLDSDPTAGLDWPRRAKQAPKPLSRAELAALHAILEAAQDWHGRRNRRALLLMLYAGLRIAEVAALDWADIDLAAGLLIVRCGKGGRDRGVPVHPRLVAELRVAAAECGQLGAVAGKVGGDHLTFDSLDHIFRRWLPKRGLKISAHRLRHSFATEMLRAGAGIESISALLGHSDIATTMIYLLVDPERLRGAVDLLPADW